MALLSTTCSSVMHFLSWAQPNGLTLPVLAHRTEPWLSTTGEGSDSPEKGSLHLGLSSFTHPVCRTVRGSITFGETRRFWSACIVHAKQTACTQCGIVHNALTLGVERQGLVLGATASPLAARNAPSHLPSLALQVLPHTARPVFFPGA